MASGVKVCDKVKMLYEDMKVHRRGEKECDNCKVAVLKICDDSIVIEKAYTAGDIKDLKKDPFMVFKDEMKSKCCCYLLYDCSYETKEVPHKEEIILAMWCPSDSKMKDKMVYSSSFNALKKIVGGIKKTMEIHEFDEMCTRRCLTECLGKSVINVEGISLDEEEQQRHGGGSGYEQQQRRGHGGGSDD